MTKKIGWAFIALSALLFLVPFVIPFFTLSTKLKVAIGGVSLLAGEGLFWLGALLVGRETVQKYMKRFFKKREGDS
jgi:hypothetical protein